LPTLQMTSAHRERNGYPGAAAIRREL